MNKPSLRDRRHGSVRFESDIHEIRLPASLTRVRVPAMPYTPSPMTCRVLATMALDHAHAAEHALGRQAGEDALLLIESLNDGARAERTVAAESALVVGEAFLLLHEAHRAKDCFELAIGTFDELCAASGSAKARLGLAKALLALHDPSARAILEDAGEMFEDLGDERTVRSIDFTLREVQNDFEESPRSFHARGR